MFGFHRRRKFARVPTQKLIEDLQYRLEGLQNNPVGVDRISERGFKKVIHELESTQDLIDNNEGNLNVIWTILAENAQFFTAIEYQQLLQLAKQTVF